MTEAASERTKKVATMLTPRMHREFAVLLKIEGARTIDEFLREAVEHYVLNHPLLPRVAEMVRKEMQDAPVGPP